MTLRRIPTDFAVTETLAPSARAAIRVRPAPGCVHAVYRLTKTGLTTPEAVTRLGRSLGVVAGAIDYAGLKDKHAVTEQHVTVAAREAARATDLPAECGAEGWSATRVGYSSHAITSHWIDRNRFTIVVRGLSRTDVAGMAKRARLLSSTGASDGSPGALEIINYFGDQRFGSARHGEGFAARHLVRGEFEQALKLLIATPARKDSGSRRTLTRALAAQWGQWVAVLPTLPPMPERRVVEVLARGGSFKDAFAALPPFVQQMCVDAYQSHLWNDIARRMVAELMLGEAVITADDDFGPMFFPHARALPADAHTIRVPMPAPGMPMSGVWADAAAAVFVDEGVTADGLVIPGLGRLAFNAFDRTLVVRAERFTVTGPERDELAGATATSNLKLRLEFDLPSGSYATVALRALGE